MPAAAATISSPSQYPAAVLSPFRATVSASIGLASGGSEGYCSRSSDVSVASIVGTPEHGIRGIVVAGAGHGFRASPASDASCVASASSPSPAGVAGTGESGSGGGGMSLLAVLLPILVVALAFAAKMLTA